MDCDGNAADHCCYLGGVCRYLEENTVPGRVFACGLRRRLGSWDAVHMDEGYIEHVRPTMDILGVDCGDWPPKGQTCAACGGKG